MLDSCYGGWVWEWDQMLDSRYGGWVWEWDQMLSSRYGGWVWEWDQMLFRSVQCVYSSAVTNSIISLLRQVLFVSYSSLHVIDIAWQSVPYGLYSTEPEGRRPEDEGYISCTACDWYAICIIYPNCILAKCRGTCALLGSNRQHRRRVLSNSTGAS